MLCVVSIISVRFLPQKTFPGWNQGTGMGRGTPNGGHVIVRGVVKTNIGSAGTDTCTAAGEIDHCFASVDVFQKTFILLEVLSEMTLIQEEIVQIASIDIIQNLISFRH